MKSLFKLGDLISFPRTKRATALVALTKGQLVTEGKEVANMEWVLARPENAKPLGWRLRAAWEVLRGRGVPVEWI